MNKINKEFLVNYLWFSCALIPVWVFIFHTNYWKYVAANDHSGLGGIGLGGMYMLSMLVVGFITIIGMIIYGYFVSSAIKGNYLGSLRGMAWFVSIPNSILLFLFIGFLFLDLHQIDGCNYGRGFVSIYSDDSSLSARKIDGAYIWNFSCNDQFGRTKANVFFTYGGVVEVIEGADPATIRYVVPGSQTIGGNFYIKDDNFVFYFSGNFEDGFVKVNGANPDKFNLYKGRYYYADDKNIYYKGLLLDDADLNTFTLDFGMDDDFYFFAKDNKSVYYEGRKMEKIDVKTFEVIDWVFSKDMNNVYFRGESFGAGSVRSKVISLLGEEYGKYKHNVYDIDE